MIGDVREMVSEVVTERDPGRPGFHGPERTGLLLQANDTGGFIEDPELRVRILLAVVGATLIEANLGGETVIVEEPDGIDFTREE